MNQDTKQYRDRFAFSLRGMTVVNAHAMVPAIADDGINRVWDARLRRIQGPAPSRSQLATTHQIEALLARYFAHGCCTAT